MRMRIVVALWLCLVLIIGGCDNVQPADGEDVAASVIATPPSAVVTKPALATMVTPSITATATPVPATTPIAIIGESSEGIPIVDMFFDTKEDFYRAVVEREQLWLERLRKNINHYLSVRGVVFCTQEGTDERWIYIDDELYVCETIWIGYPQKVMLYAHKDDIGKWPRRGTPIGEEERLRFMVRLDMGNVRWWGEIVDDHTLHIPMSINTLLETKAEYLQTGTAVESTRRYRAVGYERDNIKSNEVPWKDYELVYEEEKDDTWMYERFVDNITPLEQVLFDDLKENVQDLMRASGLPAGEYSMTVSTDLASRGIWHVDDVPSFVDHGFIILRDLRFKREYDDNERKGLHAAQAGDRFMTYTYRYDTNADVYVYDFLDPVDSGNEDDMPNPLLIGTKNIAAGGFNRLDDYFPIFYAYQDFTFE